MNRASSGSGFASGVVLAGWAAKAIVYVALAWLVLQLAVGGSSRKASTQGALHYIAASTHGRVVMIVLGLGLLAFAAGRVLEATLLATKTTDVKDKVTAAFLALLYTSVAVSAFGIAGLAGGSASGSGGSSPRRGTSLLLGMPGGRFVVGAVGLTVVGFGLWSAYKGISKRFLGTLRTSEMSAAARRWATRIGVTAYLTKGAVFVLLGWFLVKAALAYDAQRARGLDGALREVSRTGWGPAVLTTVAVGLLAYGVFCGMQSRYRRVGSSVTGTT